MHVRVRRNPAVRQFAAVVGISIIFQFSMHDELIMEYRDWTWSYVSHHFGYIQKKKLTEDLPLLPIQKADQ